jgi:nucleotide-binding universal stress UspA family protein
VVKAARCPVVVVPTHSSVQLASGPPAVVCGVDRTTEASDVLITAAELAGALGSELVAVHEGAPVHMTPPAAGMPASPTTTAWDEARQAAREITQRAVDEVGTEIPVRLRCEIGDPAHRLASAAADEPSAILVVASRGHGPLRSALFDSVASRLCASAPVPVVVVPHGGRGSRLDTQRVEAASKIG